MHILTASLFGFAIWLPFILYTAATSGSVLLAVALGPVIVSGAAGGLILLEWAVDRLTAWLDERPQRRPE